MAQEDINLHHAADYYICVVLEDQENEAHVIASNDTHVENDACDLM